MYKLIQVRYRNQRQSAVDDVTLNELILTGKIKQFYRPSEGRWVDIDYDKVRLTKTNGYEGPERREPLQQKKQEQRPEGLLSRFLHRKPEEEKPLSAQDWFERGFTLLHSGDTYEAIRAFASSLESDPSNARAYLNRGMAYERMNNVQQAFEDYSKAIQLLPQDGKVYYIRGMILWRYGLEMEGVEDMKVSARLRYRLAIDFLTQKKIVYD